jgi:hypothetical protein
MSDSMDLDGRQMILEVLLNQLVRPIWTHQTLWSDCELFKRKICLSLRSNAGL